MVHHEKVYLYFHVINKANQWKTKYDSPKHSDKHEDREDKDKI